MMPASTCAMALSSSISRMRFMRVMAQDDAAAERHRGSGQTGGHAARDDRDALAGCQLNHLADLFGAGGQHHHIRAVFLEGAVVAVDRQVFGRG